VTRAKHARLRFEASGTWYRSITRVRLVRDISYRRRAIILATIRQRLQSLTGVLHMWRNADRFSIRHAEDTHAGLHRRYWVSAACIYIKHVFEIYKLLDYISSFWWRMYNSYLL